MLMLEHTQPETIVLAAGQPQEGSPDGNNDVADRRLEVESWEQTQDDANK